MITFLPGSCCFLSFPEVQFGAYGRREKSENTLLVCKVATYVIGESYLYGVCMYVCMSCMYVMYVCMYARTYVMYVCMHVCMSCMYVCMYVCMHVCTYVCMSYMHVCMYVCTADQEIFAVKNFSPVA